MFVGHYAPALALARGASPARLWHLFVAAQALDFVFDALVLAGVEHARVVPGFTASNDLDLYDMPWSHSAAAAVAWALLGAAAWWAAHRHRPAAARGAALIGVVIASHWVLDALVHTPDLSLAGGDSRRVGLGLWNHRALALGLEVALVVAATAALAARPPEGRRRAPFIGIGVALVAVGIASVYVVPPPPTPAATVLAALAAYVAFTIAAARAGRRGTPGTRSQPAATP